MSDATTMTPEQKQIWGAQLAHRAIVAEILKLLINKGVLSQEEAKQLLRDAAGSFVKPQVTEMEGMAAGLIAAIGARL
jgi:hypothetical protein